MIAGLRSEKKLPAWLVDRLLRGRPKVAAPWVEELIGALRCDDPAWHDYWREGDHLIDALTLLDPESRDSAFSRRLMGGMVDRIAADNFDDGGLLESLTAAARQFPRSLERQHAERLDGWNALSVHFASPPKSPPRGTATRLRTACDAVGQTPEELAERWFGKWVASARTDAEQSKKTGILGPAILGFYENEDKACNLALALAEKVNDPRRRRDCKTELFQAIASDENRNGLAEKFQHELRDTAIRPDVKLRDAGRHLAPGQQKRPGAGRSRIPAKLAPFVASFIGGAAFAAGLMLLLSPLIGNWWQSSSPEPPPVAGEDPALTKAKSQLAARTAELETSEQQLADSKAEVKKLGGQLSRLQADIVSLKDKLATTEKNPKTPEKDGQTPVPPPGPGAGNGADKLAGDTPARTGGGAGAAVPKTETAAQNDQLNALILKNPLEKVDFQKARGLAAQLAERPTGVPGTRSVSSVKRLLDKLSTFDVPTDITSGKQEADLLKTDFAFFKSGQDGPSAIAALKGKNLTCYFLDPAKLPHWLNQVRLPQCNVLASASSGEILLLGSSPSGAIESLRLVRSAKFYDENISKKKTESGNFDGPAVAVPDGYRAPKLAVSDDGKWFAVAEPASKGNYWGPKVEVIRASGPTDEQQNTLDFTSSREDLSNSWKVKDISFARDARTLVVGFDNKPFLIAFGLIPDPAKAKLVNYGRTVRGWAHSSDGRLAVVTEFQVFVDDLIALRDDQHAKSNVIPNGVQGVLNCVAFSPKATIVATGDEAGAVAIRILGEPYRGTEVLRLAHIGPILKLGFSPDGRILAALAQTSKEAGGTSAARSASGSPTTGSTNRSGRRRIARRSGQRSSDTRRGIEMSGRNTIERTIHCGPAAQVRSGGSPSVFLDQCHRLWWRIEQSSGLVTGQSKSRSSGMQLLNQTADWRP